MLADSLQALGAHDADVTSRQVADATCRHCHLPLRRKRVRGDVDGESFEFCCYGCALAQQITAADGEQGAAATILIRLGLAVFLSMNVMMVSMPTYAAYVYGGEYAADGGLFLVLRYIAMAFTFPVLLLLGGPILQTAIRGLSTGTAAADGLIVLGTAAAVGLSSYHTIIGEGPIYFETACVLLVLVTLGRYLEARARADASEAVRRGLIAPTTDAVIEAGEAVRSVAISALRPGDVVRVAPGQSFPTDGEVIDGDGSVDEAMLTGESRPVRKQPGSKIAGGTLNIDGFLRIRVSARASDSAAARIVRLLEEAARSRGHYQRLADQAGAVFVPFAILTALGAGIVWGTRLGADHGVLVFLSVLAVACPCALGIATPMAVWRGLASAARRGVILRNAATMERISHVTTVWFDKTGTLTERRLRLERIVRPGNRLSEGDALDLAATLEKDVRHPVAEAIVARWANQAGNSRRSLEAERRALVPGKGVSGTVGGHDLTILGMPHTVESVSDDSSTVAILRDDLGTLAEFHLSESVRSEAAATLAALRQRGCRLGLLSGDRQAARLVPAVFSADEAETNLLPQDKLARIQSQRGMGTMMIGDGLNDAPALAAADVGVAVGDAADTTRMSADVVVVADTLERIPWLFDHAVRVRRIVRQNLVWAFGYNTVALVVAALGELNPIVASLAMLFSSAAVAANSRRVA